MRPEMVHKKDNHNSVRETQFALKNNVLTVHMHIRLSINSVLKILSKGG